MPTHLLLAIALLAPETTSPVSPEAPAPLAMVALETTDLPEMRFTSEPWNSNSIRDHLKQVVRRMNPASRAVAIRDVPDLVMLVHLIEASNDFSRTEKVTLHRIVENRLIAVEEGLQREVAQLQREAARDQARQDRLLTRSTRGKSLKAVPLEAGLKTENANPGGGALAQAQQLIELIHAVIAPETWDVNGGSGTIRYFPNFQSLIIRAPQHVHHEIGNTLTTLQQIQR